jgi:hypothetical protein
MPVGSPYNGGQTPLEAAAIAARNTLIPINIYNGFDFANNYTATHTRALSDQTTPVYGKGSGQFLDIDNYGGVGGEYDTNGNQNLYIGSGRLPMMASNSSLWGYGPNGLGMTNYQYPDMSLNVGQVIIY